MQGSNTTEGREVRGGRKQIFYSTLLATPLHSANEKEANHLTQKRGKRRVAKCERNRAKRISPSTRLGFVVGKRMRKGAVRRFRHHGGADETATRTAFDVEMSTTWRSKISRLSWGLMRRLRHRFADILKVWLGGRFAALLGSRRHFHSHPDPFSHFHSHQSMLLLPPLKVQNQTNTSDKDARQFIKVPGNVMECFSVFAFSSQAQSYCEVLFSSKNIPKVHEARQWRAST